jgi:hypothetical protein
MQQPEYTAQYYTQINFHTVPFRIYKHLKLSRKALVATVQFHLMGRTVTHDFKRSVREILALPPLRQYYCNKFGWSNTIFDTVDWAIFRPVYKRYVAKTGI